MYSAEDIASLRSKADQGDPEAQFKIGNLYRTGCGEIPKDYSEAVNWYQKAADQDFAKAQFNLGLMYSAGHGVSKKDETEASRLIDKAADQELAVAQVAAAIYRQAMFTETAKSLELFRKAAEQGNAFAQMQIGSFYLNGKFVDQNYGEAVKWLRMAADQGQAQAQGMLADVYDNGWGVTQNCEDAYFWSLLFLKTAREFVEKEDPQLIATLFVRRFERKLSSQQIADVKKRVDEWKAVPIDMDRIGFVM